MRGVALGTNRVAMGMKENDKTWPIFGLRMKDTEQPKSGLHVWLRTRNKGSCYLQRRRTQKTGGWCVEEGGEGVSVEHAKLRFLEDTRGQRPRGVRISGSGLQGGCGRLHDHRWRLKPCEWNRLREVKRDGDGAQGVTPDAQNQVKGNLKENEIATTEAGGH